MVRRWWISRLVCYKYRNNRFWAESIHWTNDCYNFLAGRLLNLLLLLLDAIGDCVECDADVRSSSRTECVISDSGNRLSSVNEMSEGIESLANDFQKIWESLIELRTAVAASLIFYLNRIPYAIYIIHTHTYTYTPTRIRAEKNENFDQLLATYSSTL